MWACEQRRSRCNAALEFKQYSDQAFGVEFTKCGKCDGFLLTIYNCILTASWLPQFSGGVAEGQGWVTLASAPNVLPAFTAIWLCITRYISLCSQIYISDHIWLYI